MTLLRKIDEQRALVEEFTRPAPALFPLARLRDGPAADATKWQQIAELGWLGISLAEEFGGTGLGPLEEVIAAERLGRLLMTPSFLASVIAARGAANHGLSDVARDLASGARRAALAWNLGEQRFAVDAEGCDLAITLDGQGVSLHEIIGLDVHDNTHWSLPVQHRRDGATLYAGQDAELAAFAQLLAAATLAGVATQACELGVEFAKIREQFGRPIGAFQAVKHYCANMAINAYGARELAAHGAMALADGEPQAGHLARAALNFSLRAARRNGGICIQIHGGIGFSAEYEAHNFVKRSHLIEMAFGGINTLRQQLLH